MYATVHQGSGNSEDVLDWSQTWFFFPKGPYYHAELSDGKPSRKSHLHFWCISSTSNVSLLACVKVKNALEVADLLSFSFLLYFFQPIVWTLDPCWVWYFRLGAGQGIPWEHWHLASSVVWGWGLHDENQAGRQFHFRPLNRWLSQHTFWHGWNPLPGLGDHSRSWRQVTQLPLCILPTPAATATQGHHYQHCHLSMKRRQDTTLHPREPGGSPGAVGWSDCPGEVRHLSQHYFISCTLSPVWWSLSHGSVGHSNAGLAWAFPCSKQVAVPFIHCSFSARRSLPPLQTRPSALLSMAIVVATEVKLWKWGINCLKALIIFSGAEIICQTREPF